MERVSFSMGIAPEHVSEYVRMHREPWPELLSALERSGWKDYSLFLSAQRVLVGYLRAADWSHSSAAMGGEPVSSAWSVEMDRLVDPAFPLVYRSPITVRSVGTPGGRPRRRCAMIGEGLGDPTSLASRLAQLEDASALAPWSQLVVVDTGAGAALYGEHPEGAEAAWPVEHAFEMTRVFCLPELLEQQHARDADALHPQEEARS